MKLLTKEQQGSYENAKICYICKENFENKYLKDRKYRKVGHHCQYTRKYRETAHTICNSKYSVSKKIPIVFHNGFNYDYHFMIKEFKEKFTYLRENTEKYITFTVSIEKTVKRIDKKQEEIAKNISYILQFIDSARFMPTSLSNSVKIFLKKFTELNVNTNMAIKNVKTAELNIIIATVSLNTQNLKII